MIKNIAFLGFFFFGLHFNLQSQNLSPLRVEQAYYPGASLNSFDSTKTQIHELNVSVLFPFRIKQKLSFLIGPTYHQVFPENSDDLIQSSLFFLGLNSFSIYRFSDSSMLVVNILPAISTSSKSLNLNAENILLQGGVFYRKVINSNFSYMLGVLSTSRFGRPLILPAIDFTYEPNHFIIHFNFPFKAEIFHKPNDHILYGLNISLNGSQYNFNEQDFNNIGIDLARFSRVVLGPILDVKVKGPLWFTLQGGVAANRNYSFELESDETIDLSLKNGLFIASGLFIKPQNKSY